MKRIFTIILIVFTTVFASCKKMETPAVITIELTNITVLKTADDAATITATFDYPGDLSSFTLCWDGDGTLDSFNWMTNNLKRSSVVTHHTITPSGEHILMAYLL